ncbi:unnamed protein product [Somion occarium]|uniref:Uncharacterized protein n=1 Tax=Somion occarium TaxID=3059160 RepID=A0ABP1DVM8_9APHY
MALFFDISGFVFGALGVVGVFQLIFSLIHYFTPRKRLNALEETYSQTYALFRCGLEEGLFLPKEAQRTEENLRRDRAEMNTLRARVFCARGFYRQCLDIWRGLSRRITAVEQRVQELRVQILSTSEKGRARLESNGQLYKPCISPPHTMALLSSTQEGMPLPDPRTQTHSVEAVNSPNTTADVVTSRSDPNYQPTPHCISSANEICRASIVPEHRDSISSMSSSATLVALEAGCRMISGHGDTSGSSARPASSFDAPICSSSNLDLVPVTKTSSAPFVAEPDVDPDLTATTNHSKVIADLRKCVEFLTSIILSSPHLRKQLATEINATEMDISDSFGPIHPLKRFFTQPHADIEHQIMSVGHASAC